MPAPRAMASCITNFTGVGARTTSVVSTQGVAPNTSLDFRHALTAIHFTVGQNLWAGRIDKIEISGAINKGTYTLSSDPAQPGTWALGTTTGTFTLSGININTAQNPGSVITDDNGNYTFFMIPQQVTGKNSYPEPQRLIH